MIRLAKIGWLSLCVLACACVRADDSVNSEFLSAIKLDDVPAVQRLLVAGADANFKDSRGTSALHWAAASGSGEIVKALLDHGANANTLDSDLSTPLHLAVNSLVVARSSAPHPSAQQVSSVVNVVRLLAAHGADVNAPTRSDATALDLAALAGQVDVVDALLDAGAKANAADRSGISPLLLAARVGRADIGEHLIAHGADPNAPTHGVSSPLTWAAQHGDADFASMLLTHGANVNAKDSQGKTPLYWAIQSNIYFKATNAESSSPIAWFALAVRNQSAALKTDDGWTALTRELQASRQRWHEVDMSLLDHGAEIGKDRDSDVTVYDAVFLGDFELLKALVEHKANANATRFDESLLQAAIEEQRADMAEYLIDRGANINSTNINQRTPLHLVAKKIHDAHLAETLLAHGAKVNAVDGFGETPLAAATRVGNTEVATVLRQHGGQGSMDAGKSADGSVLATPARTLQVPACGEDFYPYDELRNGHVGVVVVKLCVGPNDRIDRPVEITTRSGFPGLDAAAARCMQAGRYEAGTVNGIPVASCKNFKVTFGQNSAPSGLFSR